MKQLPTALLEIANASVPRYAHGDPVKHTVHHALKAIQAHLRARGARDTLSVLRSFGQVIRQRLVEQGLLREGDATAERMGQLLKKYALQIWEDCNPATLQADDSRYTVNSAVSGALQQCSGNSANFESTMRRSLRHAIQEVVGGPYLANTQQQSIVAARAPPQVLVLIICAVVCGIMIYILALSLRAIRRDRHLSQQLRDLEQKYKNLDGLFQKLVRRKQIDHNGYERTLLDLQATIQGVYSMYPGLFANDEPVDVKDPLQVQKLLESLASTILKQKSQLLSANMFRATLSNSAWPH